MESASQQPISTTNLRIALTISNSWLDEQVARNCGQTVRDKLAVLAESYDDDSALEALIKWGFTLTDAETAGQLQVNPELHFRMFERILLHASKSLKNTPWPASLVETGLSIFSQPHGEDKLRRKWPTQVLVAALKIFGKLDLRVGWSQKMTDLLHALLRTSSELGVVDRSLRDAVWRIPFSSYRLDNHEYINSVIGQYSQAKDAVSETAVGALLCRPVGGQRPSSWELAVKISRDLDWRPTLTAHGLAMRLAIISQKWPSEHDLKPLVDELAGGERGIQLALAHTGFFISVAIHARMASPDWWKIFGSSLLALSNEQWAQRKYPQHHATPEALVDEIEQLGSCGQCTAAIQEFRAGPEPDQDTREVSDPHDSPAAVPTFITSDDIHPTEPSAPSNAILSWSRAMTAVRAVVRLRAPLSRAQQDAEMQATPLVASTSLRPDPSTGDALDNGL
ncbi:hypothetical protein BKA62DRAFT_676513 [Auriculariales sp. MPI-PUGE-AT-0066]|nr:hypothetical protein BKA62DRAFT_676513 [Auriculariales sp. MPI-PUGE-AT-0066]